MTAGPVQGSVVTATLQNADALQLLISVEADPATGRLVTGRVQVDIALASQVAGVDLMTTRRFVKGVQTQDVVGS